jgi:hypothetical protein
MLSDFEDKNIEIFIPILSVARSSLKKGEDFLVGNQCCQLGNVKFLPPTIFSIFSSLKIL